MDDLDALAKFARLLLAAPAVAVSLALAFVGSLSAAVVALDARAPAAVAALAMAATFAVTAGCGFWVQGRIDRAALRRRRAKTDAGRV